MAGVGEAAVVIGLFSGVVALLGAVIQVYEAVHDKSGLPETIREAASRLPAVCKTLEHIKKRLKKRRDTAILLGDKIKACETKVNQLKEIFEKVIPQSGEESPKERYLKAIRAMGMGSRVKTLMDGLVEDLHLMVDLIEVTPADHAWVRLARLLESLRPKVHSE